MSSDHIEWAVHPHVARTIVDDSFKGWEDVVTEAVKNSLDAGATKVYVELPAHDVLVPLDKQRVVVKDNWRGMSRQDLEENYCTVGRPKERSSSGGRVVFGIRGTGKLANCVVADRVSVSSWRDGTKLSISFRSLDIARSRDDTALKIPIVVAEVAADDTGTELVLSDFKQEAGPPTRRLVEQALLRHFAQISGVQFTVNNDPFRAEDHARVLAKWDEDLKGVGRVHRQVWLANTNLKEPGLVVYSGGQPLIEPSVMGLENRGYTGDAKTITRRLLGRLEIAPEDGIEPTKGVWMMTPAFMIFERWAGEKLDQIVRDQTEGYAEARVDKWLGDPQSRRLFNNLPDAEKALARRILKNRAMKAGDTAAGQSQERIIARLILRALKTNGLYAILEALDDADDETVGMLAEILQGEDAWNLRQIAVAASTVKEKLKAIDRLDRCVADYASNESAIHRILEANPWIIADDYHSFRSNRQIRTALETHEIITPDDEGTRKRPDFVFILGDDASNARDEHSRFLFVELKGPGQPLKRKHQNQAVGDAARFLEYLPGFAYVVLIGVEFAPNSRPGAFAREENYEFKSMTYRNLINRARFRLAYLAEGVEATRAEEVARKVIERQLDDLAN